mmetsp:Transcript_118566/g.232872  ORF Transcript_118566/g.232872 Transcript_118566/m.232872 type:complete len:80 (+) Transcript_118566:161-400(+)
MSALGFDWEKHGHWKITSKRITQDASATTGQLDYCSHFSQELGIDMGDQLALHNNFCNAPFESFQSILLQPSSFDRRVG